jgi:hypothetical protein
MGAQTQILVEPAYWLTAEVPASEAASATCYRRPENVGVLEIVEPKLELREIERQILLAHIMVGAQIFIRSSFSRTPLNFQMQCFT